MALQLFLSGGISNTSPFGSLGGAKSGTTIVDATLQNLIDNISRKEILVGKTEYRCFYVFNSSTTIPVHGAVIYIDQDPSASTVTMGLDPAGSGDGVNSGVAQSISTEDTAPTGVVFEDAGQYRLKIPLPTLFPEECQAVWFKRIATVGVGGTITVGITTTGDESALPTGPGTEDFHTADGVSIGERTSVVTLIAPFKIGEARIGFAEIS